MLENKRLKEHRLLCEENARGANYCNIKKVHSSEGINENKEVEVFCRFFSCVVFENNNLVGSESRNIGVTRLERSLFSFSINCYTQPYALLVKKCAVKTILMCVLKQVKKYKSS